MLCLVLWSYVLLALNLFGDPLSNIASNSKLKAKIHRVSKMQLDIQAIGKALNQIISVLGISCLKDKNKFYSAIADFLPGCSFEVERNILCACICSEVSGSLIEAASKSQNEKQLAFNNCIQYLIKQQKLTEQQANELVKVFTLALWGEDKQVVGSKCSVTKAKEQKEQKKADDGFALLRKVAEQGDVKAQLELGNCYYNGNGVNKDEAEAEKWWRKAAEQGNKDAVEQFRKLAEQGNVAAQYNLGKCYYNGNGANKDEVEAAKWYRKAAEQGHADAQNSLGNCCYYGNGVNKDYAEAVKWYRKAAEQGNVAAQYNLGDCYYNGNGVNENEAEAVKWLSKAAGRGNVKAQCRLGECYYNGHGVNKNEAEAVKWWRQAAEQGNADAQNNLGNCYYNGEGVNKDYAEAAKWYRKAAEQGHADAQNNLGGCYYSGNGVNENEAEAVKWLSKAAGRGNVKAQCRLGYCYYNGNGVNKNEAEAVKWYRKAAEQGHAGAQRHLVNYDYTYKQYYMELGRRYYTGDGVSRDYAEAVKWFSKCVEIFESATERGDARARELANQTLGLIKEATKQRDKEARRRSIEQAAERGSAEDKYNIGNDYYNGNGVNKDYAEAIKWYRKAAEQGDVRSQLKLGECYYNGNGVNKDYAEAVKWWRRAAEQGNANAQLKLGECYYNGNGVNKDYAEAVKWYRRAAEQGYVRSQLKLGNCYYNGEGVNKDYAEAAKWYSKVAEQGNKDAVERLRKIAEQGDVNAQYALGNCYYNGNGVNKDEAEAAKWYSEAAKQGNKDAVERLRKIAEHGNLEYDEAQYKLGCLLLKEGQVEEAKAWLRKAAQQSYSEARHRLDDIIGKEKDRNSREAIQSHKGGLRIIGKYCRIIGAYSYSLMPKSIFINPDKGKH